MEKNILTEIKKLITQGGSAKRKLMWKSFPHLSLPNGSNHYIILPYY